MIDHKRSTVAHIIFRLDYGGLENGLVNIVNSLHDNSNRHVVITLAGSTEFRNRLLSEVEVYDLQKKPGKDPLAYVRLFKLLRKLRPEIVHTRNIGTLDCVFVAAMAGIRVRIHGEHGWDVFDREGTSARHRIYRRIFGMLVQRFVVVSEELQRWLTTTVKIPSRKLLRIGNGVDTEKFRPPIENGHSAVHSGLNRHERSIVIGSVTRFSEIKDPLNLARAFIGLMSRPEMSGKHLRLVMIGAGELREEALRLLDSAGLSNCVWLPGSRDDVADQLHNMHIFVLGSEREGISNTVLEAMSCGLPIVATRTGGNIELISEGVNGELVPTGDSGALEDALAKYVSEPELIEQHGIASRRMVEEHYSLREMIDRYQTLYCEALATGMR